MNKSQSTELSDEVRQFQTEQEKIRRIVGQIGGGAASARDRMVTLIFIALLVLLSVGDVSRHLFHFSLPIPPMVSLEVGVLLVSFKIIWMIQKQTKVDHFQFWILNSIEFRLDQMSKQLNGLEARLRDRGEEPGARTIVNNAPEAAGGSGG